MTDSEDYQQGDCKNEEEDELINVQEVSTPPSHEQTEPYSNKTLVDMSSKNCSASLASAQASK